MTDLHDIQDRAAPASGPTRGAISIGGDRAGAALFDIDGILVDSHTLHLDSWSRTFRDLGQDVDGWRIHRGISTGPSASSDAMVVDAAGSMPAAAGHLHVDYDCLARKRLRAFRDARALLHDLSERGVIVVLATSAAERELALLRTQLAADDAVDMLIPTENMPTSGSVPDAVLTALRSAGVEPSRAIFIGDTIWDVAAARHAGVDCIGIASGDASSAELLSAGAIAVYNSIASLRENVDISPLAALWA